MKVLIIYGHPKASGFSFQMEKRIEKILQEKKADFEILDLYEINYDPVLKLEELYTIGNRNVSEQNHKIQEKIKNSDRLIFIYPVWWGGMPAILKGFMDRVFTPGFAFSYRHDKFLKFIPDKLLNDKKIAIFTSSGGPKFFYKILLDPVKLINKFFIFGMSCSKIKTYQIYGAVKLEERKEKEITNLVKKGIGWLLR